MANPQDKKLRWRLQFLPEFQKPAKQMREAVAGIRAEVRGLVDDIARMKSAIASVRGIGGGGRGGGGGGRTTAAPGGADDERARRRAAQEAAREERRRLQELAQAQRNLQQVDRTRAAINAAERREARREALQDITLFRRSAVERERIERHGAAAQRQASREQRQVARERLRAAQELNSVQEGGANRLLFTFRRLVGVLAVFTLAREAVNAFGAGVRSALQFSQLVNASRIGIAGLVSTLGQVKDAQGNVLSGAEAFNASIAVSRKLQQQLLKDAIRTTATYKELLDVFQIAVGPGLAAGLNLDQIRQLSVLVSQAATALQIPQVQLSEEIRALLTGQIRQGQSRLATSILLTPEQVRRFKAQGTLFQELQRRLQGFDIAAEATARTAGGALLRVSDAIQLVLGQAAKPLENSALLQLDRLFQRLISVSADGLSLDVNPQAVAAFQEIFNILSDVVNLVGDELANIDLSKLRQTIADLRQPISDIIRAAFELGKAVLSGLAFVTQLLAPLAKIAQLLSPIGGFILSNLLIPLGAVRIALGTVLSLFLRLPLIGNLIQRALVNAAAKAGREFDLATEKANALRRLALTGFVIGIAVELLLEPEAIRSFADKVGAVMGNALLGLGVISQKQFDASTQAILTRQAQERKDAEQRAQPDTTGATAADIKRELTQASVDPKKQEADAESLAVARAEFAVRRQGLEIRRQETDNEAALTRLRLAGASDDQVRAEELRQQLGLIERRRELARLEREEADAQLTKRAVEVQNEEERNAALAERANILTDLRNKQADLDRQQLEAATELSRLNRQINTELQNRAETARASLQASALEFQATRLGPSNQPQAEALRGRAELVRLQAEQRALLNTQARILADRRAAEDGLTEGSKARQQAELETLLIIQEQSAVGLQLQTRIDAAEKAQRRLQARAEGDISLGISFAFDDFIEQVGNGFDVAVNIAKDSISSLGNFVTKTVVDGFVNVGKTGKLSSFFDGIRQTFANFLIEIVQAIISQLVQLAIAKALVFAGFGGAAQGGRVGGAARGGFFGFDAGGPVPSGPPPAPVLLPRPSGLDPRDTIPAFLRKGEFVQTPEAVRAYGADFMEGLRRRAIDPTEARALMRGARFSPRRVAMHGFAEGGPVLATPTVTRENTVLPGGGGTSRTPAAVLPVREDQVDRMVNSNGFTRSMNSWLRRNRTQARQNINTSS